MKILSLKFVLSCLFFFWGVQSHLFAQYLDSNHPSNQLLQISQLHKSEFKWMNTPKEFDISQGLLTIQAVPETDFFIDPENNKATATAPFLYREIEGDFVATTLVKPDFKDQWNAAALLMMIDKSHWIKFAFENSDATGKSIVSVVTRMVSDDANGAILHDADQLWIKIIRKGNLYAMHWSLDGKTFKMGRLAAMPGSDIVKIGMQAQSPVGKTAHHQFLYFNLETKTAKDLRKGE